MSATSTQGAQGCLGQHLLAWAFCASLVCSLFSSGVSCGWVLSGAVGMAVGCCQGLSGAVGPVGSVGLSGLSGCVGSVGSTLQARTRPHRHFAVRAVGLSGCRVVSGGVGCRVGVGLVSDDSVGLSSHPSGIMAMHMFIAPACSSACTTGAHLHPPPQRRPSLSIVVLWVTAPGRLVTF